MAIKDWSYPQIITVWVAAVWVESVTAVLLWYANAWRESSTILEAIAFSVFVVSSLIALYFTWRFAEGASARVAKREQKQAALRAAQDAELAAARAARSQDLESHQKRTLEVFEQLGIGRTMGVPTAQLPTLPDVQQLRREMDKFRSSARPASERDDK